MDADKEFAYGTAGDWIYDEHPEPPAKRHKSLPSPKPSSIAQASLSVVYEVPRSDAPATSKWAAHPSSVRSTKTDYINYWRENQKWPMEYFTANPEPEGMDSVVLRTRPPKGSTTSYKTPQLTESGQSNSSQAGTLPKTTDFYYKKDFPQKLQKISINLEPENDPNDLEIDSTCLQEIKKLLEESQTLPKNTEFNRRHFTKLMEKMKQRNETEIVIKLSDFVTPSPEKLAVETGDNSLEYLVDRRNQKWENCIPMLPEKTPQPDMTVGYTRDVFNQQHLTLLGKFLGDANQCSLFMATKDLYFPFLLCEVKRRGQDLRIAHRQNAYSAGHAVRAVVQIFRIANQPELVHRKVLVFSVEHNAERGKIYGHYPVINGEKTSCYSIEIEDFSFTKKVIDNRWSPYKFIKNVYEKWVPTHLDFILKEIEKIPPDFDFTEYLTEEPYPDSWITHPTTLTSGQKRKGRIEASPTSHKAKRQRVNPEEEG